MNDNRFYNQSSLKIHGKKTKSRMKRKTRKELAGWVQSINQSARRPIYSNFTPECPASVPQHRHRQSINQTEPRADLQFGLQSLFRIFTHRPNWGVSSCQPTSLGIFPILSCNQLWRKFVFVGAHIELFWMNFRHHYCRKIH